MRKVLVFLHVDGEKSGRGTLEFFSEERFHKFLKKGGSVSIRYEGGDVGFVIEPPKTDESTD